MLIYIENLQKNCKNSCKNFKKWYNTFIVLENKKLVIDKDEALDVAIMGNSNKLSVGDKILIIKLYGAMRNDIKHNQLYVFQGFKLADGTIDDIPSKLIRYVDKDN